ncbi:MAG: D-glycero-beta-D-manno-heptose 1-phosphate adenylyltransferase [Candidatus Zixiibacteriota bacterium]|nr:MAG: D-glycero-beta-D-manno-heptose 1-phosphate adenylyltransferase [candidate division Zixibacteria bacterium]
MKVITRWSESRIRRFIDGLRRKKKKIVFTNGVFDILHYGHIDYLTKARALGDVLIIGLNTDSSVRRFKLKGRPIQNEKDRARILAALEMVDYVILFSEETPERLIKAVKPDILVKGADYKIFQIVGADFVKSYGGKVRRIRLARGRSTTSIFRKIKKL